MPISICERSAKGTSLVTSSHSNTAKLHMSADLLLISSGLFCRAENQRDKKTIKHSGTTHLLVCFYFVTTATHQMTTTLLRLNYIVECVPYLMTHKVRGGRRRREREERRRKGVNTFRSHPCRRVHTTRTLEGELSI